MRKKIVKVYLNTMQYELLERVCKCTGYDKSELFRNLFMNYLKDLNVISTKVKGR